MAVVPFQTSKSTAHFTCLGCQREVHHYGHPLPDPTCMTCRFIRETPGLTDTEREELRVILMREPNKLGEFGEGRPECPK